jgi:hypothetical protein
MVLLQFMHSRLYASKIYSRILHDNCGRCTRVQCQARTCDSRPFVEVDILELQTHTAPKAISYHSLHPSLHKR